MRASSYLASLPFLLSALLSINADPMTGGMRNDGYPGLPADDFNPYPNQHPGYGRPYFDGPHQPHPSQDMKIAEPNIDMSSPMCGQLVGTAANDGVNRTESVEMSDISHHSDHYHSWEGHIKQGRAKADIKVNINAHGVLEIKIRNINYGVKFANKIAVSPVFTAKALYGAPTKWFLDTKKSDKCHYKIARKIDEISDVYVRY